MARRSLIAQILRCLLLSGTAGSLVCAPAPSSLAEPTAKPEFTGALPSTGTQGAVGAVFATRWGEPSREFWLGVDGKFHSSMRSDVDGEGGARPVSSGVQKDTHTGSHLSTGLFVEECGPSPAGPGEIKTLVAEAADRHRVDPAFALAIAFAESRFDRRRNSPKGARGPMQLMPATAVRFGVDDICNPVSNIDGGVAYLRQLFDEFRNPLLVAAAYNAGENRVREHAGIPPIAETLGFVAEVINYQLGATPVSGRIAAGERKSATPFNADAEVAAGSSTRRQWVDGVMQF
jgi:Transglycosylase SLT domain